MPVVSLAAAKQCWCPHSVNHFQNLAVAQIYFLSSTVFNRNLLWYFDMLLFMHSHICVTKISVAWSLKFRIFPQIMVRALVMMMVRDDMLDHIIFLQENSLENVVCEIASFWLGLNVLISTGRDQFIVCLSVATATLDFFRFINGEFLVARWFIRRCEENIRTDLNELSRATVNSMCRMRGIYTRCTLHISLYV